MKNRLQCRGELLETLYRRYHLRKYVHPDPLEYLYAYDRMADREVVGLVAASLAYGRVAQILTSIQRVLALMGPAPSEFLRTADKGRLHKVFKGFTHRFATGKDMACLLAGAGAVIRDYGSLLGGFMDGYSHRHPTVASALSPFCQKLRVAGDPGHLVPIPEKGSAMKRMNLFLRWMVRQDAVDPGGWSLIPASKLIIPLDVHMHRLCRRFHMTDRSASDGKTALEITAAFSEIVPEDPARYDFVLTRFGIHPDLKNHHHEISTRPWSDI